MPWTSKTVWGVVVKIPTRFKVASMVKVEVSITRSLEIVRSPTNEWEAKVSAMNLPEIWRLDEMEALDPKKALPDMEAIPPTSKVVSVAFPALMPNLLFPVISRLVDIDAPAEKRAKPSKAALPLISRSPETRRSLEAEIVPVWVVVPVPNLE